MEISEALIIMGKQRSSEVKSSMIRRDALSALSWRWLEMVFLWVTSIVLWLTAVAKLISVLGAAGKSHVLFSADPVFGVSNRNLMLSSAGLELAVVVACLAPISIRVKCALVASLGMVFLGYRLALYVVDFTGWCACLGDFGKSLFIDPSVQSAVLTAVGAWMAIGGTILSQMRHGPVPVAESS